jgi:hypothetical protein
MTPMKNKSIPSHLHSLSLFNVFRSLLTPTFSRVSVSADPLLVVVNDKFKIVFRGRSTNTDDDRSCEKVLELSILDSLAPVLRLEVLSEQNRCQSIQQSCPVKILMSSLAIDRF